MEESGDIWEATSHPSPPLGKYKYSSLSSSFYLSLSSLSPSLSPHPNFFSISFHILFRFSISFLAFYFFSLLTLSVPVSLIFSRLPIFYRFCTSFSSSQYLSRFSSPLNDSLYLFPSPHLFPLRHIFFSLSLSLNACFLSVS